MHAEQNLWACRLLLHGTSIIQASLQPLSLLQMPPHIALYNVNEPFFNDAAGEDSGFD